MKRSLQGFTLLEVIVAVVILAVGLSALFTSEGGAIRLAQRARTTTVATLLARCKMAEIEEQIMKEGFPTDGLDGRDACCEDAEHKDFSCEWKVERVVLPAELGGGEEGEDEAEEGQDGKPGGALGALMGTDGKEGDKSESDPLSKVGIPIGGSSILDSVGASLGGEGDGESSLGDDPIASLLLEMTFPIMKPVIEEQVRRATVSVRWKEGAAERSFEVVQFLVNEAEFVADNEEEGEEAGGAVPGSTTNTMTPGTAMGSGTRTPAGGN
jgi:general secretion pathway protein I